MAQFIHFDEARKAAEDRLRIWLQANPGVEALLMVDLAGRFRTVLFPGAQVASLADGLAEACGPWWTGEVLQSKDLDPSMGGIFKGAFDEARMDEQQPRLRVNERHRNRTAWFAPAVDPLWAAPSSGPPVVVFYSFKGGLGRSTLLASFAIQRARAGERVCVIDFDLDSPGAGRVLAADEQGAGSPWGVVDYLIERRQPGLRFDDYWHRCDRVAGSGELRVMPAGLLDESYADKLARVDLEEPVRGEGSALSDLLHRTSRDFAPQWILLDARTGISEPGGHLLSGLAHLHVLLGTVQKQSWLGLDLVLNRLGRDRVLADREQAEVLVVQAMVPAAGAAGEWARGQFAGRAENTFEQRYYAAEDHDAERFWTLGDKAGRDAPHVPVALDYEPRLASFRDIGDVADLLCSGVYADIGARIASHFEPEQELEDAA